MEEINGELVRDCQQRLLNKKTELLNRVNDVLSGLNTDDKGGDEADQTIRVLAEADSIALHERLRTQLFEIESALSRIENGSYGICEETEELIEAERLRAIPWTRLSIEGAEIRENFDRRYAR